MSSISHNMGEFKLIKSDVNINKKNFIGYSDGDYDLVNQFHKNSMDFSSKNNSFFGSSVFIGYDLTNKDVSKKIFDICSSDQKFVNINYETNIHNNLYLNKNFYTKENAFFNKDIFISNCMSLDTEEINGKNIINYDSDNKTISLNTYKKLLSNILGQVKNSFGSKNSAINFITNQNNSYYTQSIMAVNKKYTSKKDDNFELNCFLLVYIIKINNKIVSCKPVLDTFIIIDSKDDEIIIEDDE